MFIATDNFVFSAQSLKWLRKEESYYQGNQIGHLHFEYENQSFNVKYDSIEKRDATFDELVKLLKAVQVG